MRPSERGSALLLAILAVGMLGAGLMAVLGLSVNERRALIDQSASDQAYAIAETGINRYVSDRAALGFAAAPAAAYESTRVNVAGGHADVIGRQLRPAVSGAAAMYSITTRGYATGADGTVLAERHFQQLASWRGSSSSTIRPMGAWTSLSGIRKSSAGGVINGADACAAAPATAGVAVPIVPGYVQSSGRSVPAGSPAIRLFASAGQLGDSIPFDWAGIVAGTAVQPDVALPGGTWPVFDAGQWPVIIVNGNYTMTAGGRGTLIVTGRLIIGAAVAWQGVIIAGGDIDANSKLTISGAVFSGLNVKLAQSPMASDLRSGNHEIRYNSCDAGTALARLSESGLVRVSGTWMERSYY